MTDTTTALLRLHEREKQVRPLSKMQCALVNLLAKAAVTSAERDKKTDGLIGEILVSRFTNVKKKRK